MEALFSEKYLYQSKAWMKLKKHRKSFITKQAIEEFLSYSANMVDKKNKKNLPNKRIYHVIRLMFEALRMIEGEEPTIEMFGEERDYLLKLKTDQLSNDEFEAKVVELRQKIESLRPWPKLPEKSDESIVDKWLKEIRSLDLKYDQWHPDQLET